MLIVGFSCSCSLEKFQDFKKFCSVSVFITSHMNGKRPDGQQILWIKSA